MKFVIALLCFTIVARAASFECGNIAKPVEKKPTVGGHGFSQLIGVLSEAIASSSQKSSYEDIQNYIADCAKYIGPKIFRDSSGQEIKWQLVSKKTIQGRTFEIWYDSLSRTLWSDELPGGEDSTGGFTARSAQLNTCTGPEGRTATNNLDLPFSLPLLRDFQLAYSHGITQVVPNFVGPYWTNERTFARNASRVFNGKTGRSTALQNSYLLRVRCIYRIP